MMKSVVLQSISLRFIIVCMLLTGFPLISYATMVQISEEEGLIASLVANNLVKKQQFNADSLAKNKSYSYLHTDLLSTATTTKSNITKKQQAVFFQVDTKKIGKTWLVKNLDSELIQESLHVFKKTKQLYNKTDKILTDLTQELLRTFELEQLNKLNSRPVSEAQQKLYRSIAPNTAKKTNKGIVDLESDNIFLKVYKQLVRIETVFYLLAFLFIYSIIKWLIRQLLVPKY